MRRRTAGALLALVLGFLGVSLAAGAQQLAKVPRIGVLTPGPLAPRVHLFEAFRQGLRGLGYVEGQNIRFEFRSAEGEFERLPEFAAELVRLQVDVIVAATTAASVAAHQATKTIPIVMAVTIDPVGAGLVSSLARPGGNITGLDLFSVDLARKRLDLLKETVPGLSRVGVLLNPTNPVTALEWRETQAAAQALGIQLHVLEVRGPNDFDRALGAAPRGRSADAPCLRRLSHLHPPNPRNRGGAPVIRNDSELLSAQARVQVIQAMLAHARHTCTPESFQDQAKGWLAEWKRLDEEIRAYLSTPATSTKQT